MSATDNRKDRAYAQMYAALKRITKYQTPEQLRRRHSKDWGLDDPSEALEYAYENMQQEAKFGLRGVCKPAAATTESKP